MRAGEILWWIFCGLLIGLFALCLLYWLSDQDAYTYWRDIDANYQFEGGR